MKVDIFKRAIFLVLCAILALQTFETTGLGDQVRGYLRVPYQRFSIKTAPPVSAEAGYNSHWDESDGEHFLNPSGTEYQNLHTGSIALIQNGANGQKATIQSATTLLTGLSGGTATATNLIPAGSIVVGVTVRVTTLITGATSIDIGDGSDADRWGNDIAVTANTITTGADFTITSVPIYAAATSVVITANGSNFTAGAMRITVHYISLVAATS